MMNESFYRMCFQTLRSLVELKLISEEEKVILKDLIIKNEFQIPSTISAEQLSFFFLQLIKKQRRELAIKQGQLLIIDEETDEELI
ncbi:unnamed protein product [Paramecium sonneborni]|uniref:Uncharacterized protein n=1 Tax=Paramecium sonneborni TaxID=65129 RepID=A0A8S1PI79_9CILI|nr:unnamed protein product [Paramecium sonneborni]